MSFVDNAVDVISNGGRATSKGVEFESQYVPIERLILGLNAAYTEATIDSVSAGVSAATGATSGDQLPFTPKWAGSVTADYTLPLNADLKATFGASYKYQGSKWSDYPGDQLNTGIVIPAYRTSDARAGLNWSRYKVDLRVTNLFNEKGLDTVVYQRIAPGGDAPAWAAIIPPRTVTLSFNVKL